MGAGVGQRGWGSVFIVLRKRRQRGVSHEGVVEVTAWACRGGRGCGGYT